MDGTKDGLHKTKNDVKQHHNDSITMQVGTILFRIAFYFQEMIYSKFNCHFYCHVKKCIIGE
jgi:hypothetical protein